MKKSLSILLSLIMIATTLFALPFSANADSGTCGANVYYYLDTTTGELSISGMGAMTDYGMGQSPFTNNSNIKHIIVEEGVTSIGDYAFMTESIQTVDIPKSVTRIGTGAFWYCPDLTAVNYYSTRDDWENVNVLYSNDFDGDQMYFFKRGKCGYAVEYLLDLQTGELTISGRGDMYNYGDFENRSPFFNSEEITSVVIKSGVSTVGSYAFNDCSSLRSVEISNTVTSIGELAFDYCYWLQSVKLGSGVTHIGERAFDGCARLEEAEYAGTKETWKRINIEKGNDCLTDLLCDHVAGASVNEDYQEATCQQPAGHDVVVYCSICNAVMSREFVETSSKTAHSYTTVITPATLKANGKSVVQCRNCGKVQKKTIIYYPKSFKLSVYNYTYNGKTKKPTVSVTDANGKTIPSSKYKVTYQSGRKDIGKYNVYITFTDKKYTGEKRTFFLINPKGTSLVSASSPSKNKIKVKWKTQTSKTTGYQIKIATDKSFSKNVQTITVEGRNKNTKTISGFKKGTKYYVKVRTYTQKPESKFFSNWSEYKTVTTKK
ncbi:MAG: fibronectin type III domain-containing protein [Ruminococcaceae bacterium]|nr:fibronectin type III domain-containing protein [Oscillospiraceae bacterium]